MCQFVWSVIRPSCNSIDILAPGGIKQRKKAWRANTFRVTPLKSSLKSKQFMLGLLIMLPTISLYVLDIWFFILCNLIIFILLYCF